MINLPSKPIQIVSQGTYFLHVLCQNGNVYKISTLPEKESCDLVVVLDADLRPDDLREHCRRTALGGVGAVDVTDVTGFKSHYCYVLTSPATGALDFLRGEPLW